MREENFFYTTGWSPAMTVAGQTVTMNIQVAADSNFKAYYITGTVMQGNAGAEVLVLTWAGLVQIQDSQVGATFFNAAAPFDVIAGTGRDAYNWPPPRIFSANTTIVVTLTTNVATRTLACVTLHGAKLKAG